MIRFRIKKALRALLINKRESGITVKKYFSTFLAGTLLATGFVSVAQAGKSDDTLNVAIDRELESIDNYYNTAREGIVISRMVWDGLLYRDPKTN